ncbi:helix-turn-helix transcriptional regulator [Sneathiella aquimaris]|uniref:helix-turn-helix transcriptional regulator n=1 Tax=Sneathiella aquimaris TaxID=2599305 RepID=UPI00146E590B|nr:YafY family protein [Sneathiella aquimaris]
MRLTRLFKILDLLRTLRLPISAQSLGQKFGVSTRTVYRDIATLQELGAPIRGESGLGYQIEKGYFLPPLHFDTDELDALSLGIHLVTARSDDNLSNAAKSASAKIADALPEQMKGQFENDPFWAYSREKEEKPQQFSYLTDIRTALRNRNKLDLHYKSLKGVHSRRTVWPLGLTFFDDAWLLCAWCENKQDFRNFRVDLIQELTRLETLFHPTPGRTFNDYLRLW